MHSWIPRISLIVLIFGLGCVHSSATSSSIPADGPDVPEEAARAFLNAIRDGQATRAAELVDPSTAERFKEGLQGQRRHAELQRLNLQGPLPKTISPEELDELPPLEVMERYLRTLTPQYRVEEVRESLRARQRDTARVANWTHESKVLGAVIEGDTLAHVVYRRHALLDGVEQYTSPVQAVTLIRRPAGWRIRGGELDGSGFFEIVLSTPEVPSAQ